MPVDDDGIRAEDLLRNDRACYVTPAHQFPLGGRMPVRRRAGLLDWARTGDALVLEDHYDGEFRYGHADRGSCHGWCTRVSRPLAASLYVN